MAVNMGTAIAYLELDTSKFSKGFRSALSDLKVFGDKSATAESKLKGLSSSFKTTGGLLTKTVTTPLVGIGTAAVAVTSKFQSKMSEVKAISGATGNEFSSLKKKAIEMGAKTKYSATEAASAFKYMSMAGWDTNDMLSGISGVMNLAAASGEDLATTSDIVTDALTAFGLSAKDSSHFADILAQASSRSNTNVGLMGETFKYVAPVAGALGYSAEDCAVAIGLMANSGIKASQAGTALRSLFTRLAKPTDTVAAAMKKYNISLTDANGNMKPLSTLMVEMRDRFSGLSQAQKANLAATLAGQEGMSGLLAIVNSSDKDFKSLTDSINNADGAAEKMSETMLDNLSGAVTLLKSALESAGIIIGERLTPYIRRLSEWITKLVEKFNNLSESQQDQIVKFGLILAAVGPVMLILSKLFSILSKVVGGFKLFAETISTVKTSIDLVKAGYAGLATQMGGIPKIIASISAGFSGVIVPIVAVVSVISVLVGAFVTLWKNSEDFRNNMTAMWNELQGVFENFANQFVSRINELGFNFSSVTDMLKTAWMGFCEIVQPLFEGAFQTIIGIVSNVLDTIISLMDVFIGVYQGDWERVREGIEGVFDSIIELAIGFVENVFATLGEVGANILQVLGLDGASESFRVFFTETIPSILDGAINIIESVISSIITFILEIPNNIVNIFNTVVSAVRTFVQNVIAFFQNLPYNIGFIIGQMVGYIYNFGTSLLSWVATAIPQFVSNFVNFMRQLPGRIVSILTTVVQSVISFGANMVSNGIQAATRFVQSVVSAITSLPSRIRALLNRIPQIVSSMGGALRSAGVKAFNQLKSGIKSAIGGIVGVVRGFASTVKSLISGIVDGFKSVVSGASKAKKAASSVNGHHANGLDYVPYNGYIAELHKGERVLTKQENVRYNKGEGNTSGNGDTFIFYNTQPDPYEYARQQKKAKRELLFGV